MPDRSIQRRERAGQVGFTLVELMITVAVLAVIAAIAAPSMGGLLNNNRLNGQANEVVAGLQLARSEAIRRNGRMIACASNAGTTCTARASRFVVYVAPSDLSNPREIVRDIAMPASVQLSGPPAGILFTPSGMPAERRGDLELIVCIPTDNPSMNQRAVTVTAGGGTRVGKTNGGGACP